MPKSALYLEAAYVSFIVADEVNGPEAPDSAIYMNQWLDLGALGWGRNVLNYSYPHGNREYEVGVSWMPHYGSRADFRACMCRVTAALASRPSVALVDPNFDFATAPLSDDVE